MGVLDEHWRHVGRKHERIGGVAIELPTDGCRVGGGGQKQAANGGGVPGVV